ncbi:hypothetical protein SAMN03080615_00710 [Amphritea atlantica]|uniref:Uncharacterized protein n=1 Tax=Amphritea atlantica TaxID=355243 RepID=A0A1H9E607_9GAMM|nr:hypothetical protein SAMN03080615_00710 [Amphritea atlantica]
MAETAILYFRMTTRLGNKNDVSAGRKYPPERQGLKTKTICFSKSGPEMTRCRQYFGFSPYNLTTKITALSGNHHSTVTDFARLRG